MTEDDTQAMTIRLPRPLHERLRRLAFETRQSMNDIAVRAIDDATGLEERMRIRCAPRNEEEES